MIEDRLLLHATIGADNPRGLVVKAAAENGQPAEQHAFGFAQQSVGPVDRRPQSLFTTHRGRRTVGLQPESVPQAVEDLGQRHHPHSRRRELDPQGQTVQTSADIAYGSGVGGGDTEVGPSQPRAVDEELDSFVGERQRRHPPGQLAGHPDRRTAGSQNRQPGARAQERVGQYTARVDQVLTIVQHHQRVPVADESHERVHRGAARLVRKAERAQHRYRDHLGIGHRREIHKPHPTAELCRRLLGDLRRQPRFTDTAGTGQGDQPVIGQKLTHVVDLRGAADKARQAGRKTMRRNVIGSVKRRELDPQVGMAQLRYAFRTRQIAELMGAQVGQPDVGRELVDGQIACGTRHHDLAEMRQVTQPRRPAEGGAHIVACLVACGAQLHLAGVHRDT